MTPFHTEILTGSWIEKNVIVPTDYIQIDLQNWRLKAMELGIHTVELHNLQRLTPDVFRANREAGWSATYEASFAASNATDSNARYCLDRAVSIILKKHQHVQTRREPAKDIPFEPPPIYIGHTLYERPSTDSLTVHTVQDGFRYTIRRIVGGFNPSEKFYDVWAELEKKSDNSLLGVAEEAYQEYLLIRQDRYRDCQS